MGKFGSTSSKCFVRRATEAHGSTFWAMGRLLQITRTRNFSKINVLRKLDFSSEVRRYVGTQGSPNSNFRHSRSAAALKPAPQAGFNAAALREWRKFAKIFEN